MKPILSRACLEDALVTKGGLPADYVSVFKMLIFCPLNAELPRLYVGAFMNGHFSAYLDCHCDFLEVCTKRSAPLLVDAFSKVAGYRPFAQYAVPGRFPLFSTEWHRYCADERFAKLQASDVKDLVRLPDSEGWTFVA